MLTLQPRVLLGAGLAALLSATAACGTTVPLSQQTARGSGTDLNGAAAGGTGVGGLGAGPSPTLSTGGDGTVGLAASGVLPAGPSAADAGGDASFPGHGTQATDALPASGHGWDSKHVYIGVLTQTDSQETAKAIGVKALYFGDYQKDVQGVLDDINRSGGLFGRQVVARYYDISSISSAQNPTAAGNDACAYFSQDHPVAAVINPVTIIDYDSFRACLVKAHIIDLTNTVQAFDNTLAKRFSPYWYQITAPNWDQLAVPFARAIAAEHYFTKWNAQAGAPGVAPVKMGVLYTDTGNGQALVGMLKRALATVGIDEVETFGISATDPSTYSAAVLKFAQDGVTHVTMPDINLAAFQLRAEPQHYRPRYAVTTYNAPYAFLTLETPAAQNNGAVGVGWAPTYDVAPEALPPAGPAAQKCDAQNRKQGMNYRDQQVARMFAYAFCDAINLYVDGARAGHGVDGPSVAAGLRLVGQRFRSALNLTGYVTPAQPYLPRRVRGIEFVNSCGCFHYNSVSEPVS